MFSEPNLALGQTSSCSHFHFPARRGHAKIPQGRMLGVVFLLETESRSAAGLVRQHRREFYSLFFFFPGPGGFGEAGHAAREAPRPPGAHTPLRIAHPYAPAGLDTAAGPAPVPPHRSPDTHTHTHTHTRTLPLRARACAEPSGTRRRSAPRRIRPSPGPRDLNT